MVPTLPSRRRIRISREIEGLRITISARRHWGLILFLALWLCGWLVGESFVLKTLLTDRAGPGVAAFLVVWLALWTLGGLVAWYTWLWSLTGEETIVIGRDAMSLRRTVLGIGRATLVRTAALRSLRATEGTAEYLRRGRIVVETESGTLRFGADLTESEAEYLLGAVRSEVDIPDAAPTPFFEPAAIPA